MRPRTYLTVDEYPFSLSAASRSEAATSLGEARESSSGYVASLVSTGVPGNRLRRESAGPCTVTSVARCREHVTTTSVVPCNEANGVMSRLSLFAVTRQSLRRGLDRAG